MNAVNIEETITHFIIRELLNGEAGELDNQTPLLQWGVIDSLNLVKLVGFINETFNVEIPIAGMLPQNFKTIATITTYVNTFLEAGRANETTT